MLSTKEIKKWLLENCVDRNGNLNLYGLDFSDFDGDVCLSGMIVKRNLYQGSQKVGETLIQHNQKVKGDLYQGYQKVDGTLYQKEYIWLF